MLMGEEGEIGMLAHQPMEVGEADDHRRHHDGVDPDGTGDRDLPAHDVEIAWRGRHVAGLPVRERCGDRLDARGERRIGLVGEPVVVLM